MCYSARAMSGRKHLLLLAVFLLLERCHQKPNVSMSPKFENIFYGDLFYLSCDKASGSGVKWYFNDKQTAATESLWKIAVASSNDSGAYQCESNGEKSDVFSINVLEFSPSASLTIKTGQPVMQTGHSVILQLDNDDGLDGWNCWVYRTALNQTKKIKFKTESGGSVTFQTKKLEVPETHFWCTDKAKQKRSNQIIVRTSAQEVSLEMYPFPAVAGETLTLRCLVWGTDQISNTVFYKNSAILMHGSSPSYVIRDVTESAQGTYGCNATYTHKARTGGPSYQRASDIQEVFVQDIPLRASLSKGKDLSCSCPRGPSNPSYHWYYKNDDQPWESMGSPSEHMTPQKSGSYACRAVWANKRSFLSKPVIYQPSSGGINGIVIGIVIMLLLLGMLICLAVCYKYKKRNTTDPIYDEVVLQDIGDGKYADLQKAKKEAEYDTLNPEAPGGGKKAGEYEQLRKEGKKEELYHTLGAEGPAGGQGGYEALRKEGKKEELYHTLGAEGPAGGQGGYEALKKEGKKEELYHTLGAEGPVGGEGGYEALKKEGKKEEPYHTLGAEGPVGGEGGYEALKKEGKKEDLYHTLREGQVEEREDTKQ
ncbi:uncharacterized protein [Trachinotus anak]|uniref:uncharacterized protein n=1 Tax=Trachinotus anak TaxID=443729 RepID=UPI0039F2306A